VESGCPSGISLERVCGRLFSRGGEALVVVVVVVLVMVMMR
jgi:hypothetical protein